MANALQNQLESLRLRAYASPVGQFASWWVAELTTLLPVTFQERVQRSLRRVIARFQPGQLELFLQEGNELQQLETFPLDHDAPVQAQQIRDLLTDRELEEAPRVLVMAEDLVLRKSLSMPLAAEANLRQALGFEMDRHTPFNAADVYFDFRVIERDREKGQLHLELVVVPREVLDAQVADLTPRGIALSEVDVVLDGKPAGINLLPFEARHRQINKQARMNLLLGVVAVLLLAVVMAQSLWLRQSQIEQIEEKMDTVRVEARRVQNIRTEIDDATEAAGFMKVRRAESRPTLKVIAEVTRILPDDTYLDRLRVWDGKLQIQGKSDNAQQLIETVNLSPLFEGAGFRGSTRLDGRTQKEIFDLSADLSAEEGG